MKRKIFAILFLQFLIIPSINAQVTLEWANNYSGVYTVGSQARAIALDASGNIYVAGRSYDTTFVGDDATCDYTIIKYNSLGVLQWAHRYNSPGNDDDYGDYLAVDASGNVYVSGRSMGNGTDWDYATIKYNTDGVQEWVQRYNGAANGEDKVSAIGLDNSGNIYVTGWSYGTVAGSSSNGMAFTTIKYNPAGAELWVKKYNTTYTLNPGFDYAYGLTVDNSGNIYVTGQTMGMGGVPYSFLQQCVTIKYNPFGDSVWVQRFSLNNNSTSGIKPIAIAVNNSGSVFVTGTCSFNAPTGVDYFTIKYSSSGELQWSNTFSGPGANNDLPTSIAVDNSNVYVTGGSAGSTSDYDYATVKYDFSGVQQWVQRYNGPANGMDIASSIKLDTLGYIYVTGTSTRVPVTGPFDIATIKYDYFGNQKWLTRYTDNLFEWCGGNAMAINTAGNIFIAGASADSTQSSFATLKYTQSPTGVYQGTSNLPEDFSLSQNYPNPFNPTTTIKYSVPKTRTNQSSIINLKIFDILGREIATLVNELQAPGSYEVIFNAGSLASGIYFYQLQTEDMNLVKKMILIR